MTKALDTETIKEGSKRWAAEFTRNPLPRSCWEKALLVFLLTEKTSDWLAENDPQALKQAQKAMNGKSYLDFQEETAEDLSKKVIQWFQSLPEGKVSDPTGEIAELAYKLAKKVIGKAD
jgi:hypothetical protein